MRNPKKLCKDHNLYSYQAIKGAEMMAQAIAEDILHILNTTNVRPIHERIIEYFGTPKPKTDPHEYLRSQHKYQLP